jgi:protoporphyrinogen/coproporphyrinogen III oxidase
MSRYVVIGGGVSGLAAARLLAGGVAASDLGSGEAHDRDADRQSTGDSVVLLEASPRLGGKVLTGALLGNPVELGPDQFLRRDPSGERLCRLLGLGDDLVAPGVRSAAVYAGGRPRQLPAGLALGIPTDLDALARSGIVSGDAVAFANGDHDRPGPALEPGDVGLGDLELGRRDRSLADRDRERSAGAILRPRLGDEIVNRLVDPLVGGINAGSIDNLSLGTVAPQIARVLIGQRDVIAPLAATMPATPGTSPFVGLVGGLGRLVVAIENELHHLGCEVRINCPALGIRREQRAHPHGRGYVVETADGDIAADGVVLALPAPQAAALLAALAPEVAAHLSTIGYGSVTLVTFAYDHPVPSSLEDWSGILVPRLEDTLTTAVSLLSQKWPWMSDGDVGRPLVRVSAGRHLDDRIDSLSDCELREALVGELAQLTGIEVPPLDCLVQRWPQSFPQYVPGFSALMSAVEGLLGEHGGLALAGASLGGIGIPACISSGERAAITLTATAAART